MPCHRLRAAALPGALRASRALERRHVFHPCQRRPGPGARLLASAFLLAGIAAPSIAAPGSSDLVASTASDPRWHALIQRARQNPDRNARRALHRAGFLLTPDGSPQAELAATLDAFADPDPGVAQAARCRLPEEEFFSDAFTPAPAGNP